MQTYLDVAVIIAKKAGKIIRKNFSLGMEKQLKRDATIVTKTDLAINKLVQDALKKKYPKHGFVGEEGGTTKDEEFVWICDPLDGTLPFSHGVPTCVFMLALVQNGEPIIGVIYDPFEDRMFTAARGKGAFLNGSRIAVSKQSTVAQSIFSVFMWNAAPYDVTEVITMLNAANATDCGLCSVGYANMLVACGEFDIVIFAGGHPWDSAPCDIIVREAGGAFVDFNGKRIDYRKPVLGHIATNAALHENVVNMVTKVVRR